jgi:hypothetical protein
MVAQALLRSQVAWIPVKRGMRVGEIKDDWVIY